MNVKVILQKGGSALIEYVADERVLRSYVPASELSDDRVSDEVAEQGIPYGFPWEDITIEFDGQRYADELHNLGVWTVEDATRNPNKVWAALHATLADAVRHTLEISNQEKKRGRNGN